MIVWANLETSCPICQHRLRVREVGSGFALGQDSDLLVRMRGKHVIQAEIHTCRTCKFSGYADDFTSSRISKMVAKRYFEEVADRLHDDHENAGGRPLSQTPLPHVQYYWSAVSGPIMGLSPGEIGRRLVKAYWCLRLSPSSELPENTLKRLRKTYLRESIAMLRQGLRREKNRFLVYLVGELCRRNSNFGLATRYFERFIYREEGPLYLKHAASRLLLTTRQGDSSEKTMEEILYDQEQDSRAADLTE